MSTDAPLPETSSAASQEAWKEHTQSEDVAQSQAGSGGGDPADKVPPASFQTLVDMFTTQALVALGRIAHPASGKAEQQLPLARHFIDLLGVIEAKTASHLTPDESALLGGTLHYLRMSYIEISRNPSPPKT
jgi:hypothetical protein